MIVNSEITQKEKIPVVITTDKRGVFFGYIYEDDIPKKGLNNLELKVYEKQMCSYYSKACRGVFGLANVGPDKDCRIGRPVKWGILTGITSIVLCSDEAVLAWKAQPWG